MLLPFDDELVTTSPADPEMAALADRHYSRQTVGAREFVGSGRKLVIRDRLGLIVFAWLWQYEELRKDGQIGYNCTIFRNESDQRSSDIIKRCVKMAFDKWGANRVFTYVDPTKIQSVNPGYCFKRAGWEFVGTSKKGLHLLAKEP